MSIIAENISKEYKKKSNYSLEKVSFEVKKGEIFGLIGHNGSGKSTILKILAGVLKQSTGSVLINGNEPREYARQKGGKLGILIEAERAMYWRLTGEENLMRIAELKGISSETAREQMLYYLKRFNMELDKDKLVLNYSKGMKVKLGIIAAFLGEPEVLLLDEPLAGLDAGAKKITTELLVDFAQKGCSIVLCENNLDVVEKICDTVLLLQKGKRVAIDKPVKLLEEIAGEGVVEIKGEVSASIKELEEIVGECSQIVVLEEGIQIFTNDILYTIAKIRAQKMEVPLLSFREKNLSDYFILKGDENCEKDS